MLKKTSLPLIFAAIILVVFITVTTYSYWDNLTNSDSDKTINLGFGIDLVIEKIELLPSDGKTLIPRGAQKGINDVDEIILEYKVKLSKEALSDLFLDINAKNIKIDNSIEYSYLVDIEIIKSQLHVNNDTVDVTVIISLIDPEDESVYQAIAGKAVNFELHFAAIKS